MSYSAQNFDKHIEYISAQTTSQKKISIDFKNYENVFLKSCSKSQEIFEHRNLNNTNGYFIGFLNRDFERNFLQANSKKTSEFDNNFVHFRFKNEVNTRAP